MKVQICTYIDRSGDYYEHQDIDGGPLPVHRMQDLRNGLLPLSRGKVQPGLIQDEDHKI